MTLPDGLSSKPASPPRERATIWRISLTLPSRNWFVTATNYQPLALWRGLPARLVRPLTGDFIGESPRR
jgi:hypothetical protein